MRSKLFSVLFTVLIVSSLLFTAFVGSAGAEANGTPNLAKATPPMGLPFEDNSTITVDSQRGTSGPTEYNIAAASSGTLADTINLVINNVDWSSTSANSWTATWGPILNGQAPSQALETAITQAALRGDYADVLYVARVADLNGYSSETIRASTLTALQQLPMSKSLPGLENDDSSLYGDPGAISYEVHQRFPLWGYTYAQGTTAAAKWDLNTAYTDFAALYNKPPLKSAFGEMLWADPQSNWASSYTSRYYDECGETLSVFLILAQQNQPGAIDYADKVWTGLQNHWTGSYYEYTVGSRNVECAMGAFAEIIADYAQQKGGPQNVANYNRIAQDLSYKLLNNGWSSPGWYSPGILRHATSNSQTRLLETMGATMALDQFYPNFTPTQQATYQNMLMGTGTTKAWQGLISSNVYFGGKFSAVGGAGPINDATICGAALLFLDGIVPVTGSLNIPAREESYNDYRTPFLSSQWQFSYATQQITIPVNAGKLTFVFGAAPVSYTFPTSGVYTIQFSSDWSTILSVNGQAVPPSMPSAPQNLAATEGNAQISLTWAAPLSNGGAPITGYNIYRGTATNTETILAATDTTTAYVDKSVTNGITYYYKVTALNAAGESVASNEASAKPAEPQKTLSASATTDKTSYSKGSTATITAIVKDFATQAALPGASIALKITRGSQTVYTNTATTNAAGTAAFTYAIPKNAARATYQVTATIALSGYAATTVTATFNVK